MLSPEYVSKSSCFHVTTTQKLKQVFQVKETRGAAAPTRTTCCSSQLLVRVVVRRTSHVSLLLVLAIKHVYKHTVPVFTHAGLQGIGTLCTIETYLFEKSY